MKQSTKKQDDRMLPIAVLVVLVAISRAQVAQAMPASKVNDATSIQVNNGSLASGSVKARLTGYIRYDESDSTIPLDIYDSSISANHGQRLVWLFGSHVNFKILYSFEGMKSTHDQGYIEFFTKNEIVKQMVLMCVIKTHFDLEPIDESHYSFKINGPWGCLDYISEDKFAEVKLTLLELVVEDPELVKRSDLIE